MVRRTSSLFCIAGYQVITLGSVLYVAPVKPAIGLSGLQFLRAVVIEFHDIGDNEILVWTEYEYSDYIGRFGFLLSQSNTDPQVRKTL